LRRLFFFHPFNDGLFGVVALVTFAVLALMAFAFVLAVVFFTFAFVVALHAFHELDAAQDKVFLLVEAKLSELFPSGLHFFALGFHLSAFGFAFSLLFFSQFRHFMLALMFTFVSALVLAFMLALVFAFVVALVCFAFMLALVFAFVSALVLLTFLAARFGFAVGLAFSLLGFHFDIHLSKEVIRLLVQFSFGGFVHVVPVGVFSLQGAEGAVMLFGNDGFRFSGLLRLFGGIVASHHKEAGKTHH
jgi:hypothetical protein